MAFKTSWGRRDEGEEKRGGYWREVVRVVSIVASMAQILSYANVPLSLGVFPLVVSG